MVTMNEVMLVALEHAPVRTCINMCVVAVCMFMYLSVLNEDVGPNCSIDVTRWRRRWIFGFRV